MPTPSPLSLRHIHTLIRISPTDHEWIARPIPTVGARVYVCVADGAQDCLLRFFRERPSDVFRIKLADASWSWGGRNGRKGRKDVVAHAVAITRYTDDYYVIKNSWGEGFARQIYKRGINKKEKKEQEKE